MVVLDAEEMAAAKKEAHDEPWGRCPGMRPMRKYFWEVPVMDKLERFKQLSDSLPAEQRLSCINVVASPEAGIERIIELAAAEGLQLDKAGGV